MMTMLLHNNTAVMMNVIIRAGMDSKITKMGMLIIVITITLLTIIMLNMFFITPFTSQCNTVTRLEFPLDIH